MQIESDGDDYEEFNISSKEDDITQIKSVSYYKINLTV